LKKKFEHADESVALECGCPVSQKDLTLCTRHSIMEKRCRSCGVDLAECDEAAQSRAALRKRRRRQLKEAVNNRAPFKEKERDQKRRHKQDSGCNKKIQQRHRKPK